MNKYDNIITDYIAKQCGCIRVFDALVASVYRNLMQITHILAVSSVVKQICHILHSMWHHDRHSINKNRWTSPSQNWVYNVYYCHTMTQLARRRIQAQNYRTNRQPLYGRSLCTAGAPHSFWCWCRKHTKRSSELPSRSSSTSNRRGSPSDKHGASNCTRMYRNTQ